MNWVLVEENIYIMLCISGLIFLIRISAKHKTLTTIIFILKLFFCVNSQVIHNIKINTPGYSVYSLLTCIFIIKKYIYYNYTMFATIKKKK
jgi:hypothetical protein